MEVKKNLIKGLIAYVVYFIIGEGVGLLIGCEWYEPLIIAFSMLTVNVLVLFGYEALKHDTRASK